jgi:surface protein
MIVVVIVALATRFVVFATPTHAATCGPTTNFITTWKTDNPGTSGSTSITIPISSANYQVDWNNDGVMDETVTTDNKTHDFGSAGTRTIQICGTFPQIAFSNGGDKEKILRVDQWGNNQWTSFASAFNGASNLQVTATDTPNLSAVTDMSSMFQNATALTGNASFNTWNTSNVTNMATVFANAKAFNQPIGNWDTGNVTSMYAMFVGTDSFNQPIGGWDTSSVTNMSFTFLSATAFNQNISGWNTSNVTNMSSIFSGATAFNQPLNSWDVSNAAINGMFKGATSFNQDLSSWDTSNVTDMSGIFSGATAFNRNISSWDTSNVTYMASMFLDASSFNQPIGNWDVSNVTSMNQMFANASSFNQPIGAWNVSNVTDMQMMFAGAKVAIADINVPSINVFSIPMTFDQNLSAWDVSNVTNMWGMFSADGNAVYGSYYSGLGVTIAHADAPLTHPFSYSLAPWDVHNVSDMRGMLSHSSLSAGAYDATLTAWAGQSLQSSVLFGADGLGYCTGGVARQSMITNFGWTITNDSQNCLTLAPGSNLTGVDLGTGDPLVNPDATHHIIRLLKSGIPLVDVTVDFNSAIDWSTVTGATDAVNFKSVVAGLAGAQSTVGMHTLYVPKAAFHTGVVVCPHAITLGQVTETCPDAKTLTTQSASLSVVNIGGQNYWKITGLSGTGAMGTVVNVPGAPSTGLPRAVAMPTNFVIVIAVVSVLAVGSLAVIIRRYW